MLDTDEEPPHRPRPGDREVRRAARTRWSTSRPCAATASTMCRARRASASRPPSALINEYGDLDTLLARAGEIKQDKRRQTLIDFADQIRLSRELVRLDCDTPLPAPIDELAVARAGRRRCWPPSWRRWSSAPSPGGWPRRRRRRRAGRAAPARRAEPRRARPIDTSAYVCVARPGDARRLDRPRPRGRASSPSTPRPTPCPRPTPASAACRWPSRRARPATSRSATARPTGLALEAAGDARPDPAGRGDRAAEAAAGRPGGAEGRRRTPSTTWPCCRATASRSRRSRTPC